MATYTGAFRKKYTLTYRSVILIATYIGGVKSTGIHGAKDSDD